MEQYGNTSTYNLESVLHQNIKRSLFWERRAQFIDDIPELIDVIYDECVPSIWTAAGLHARCRPALLALLARPRATPSGRAHTAPAAAPRPRRRVHDVEPWMSGNARGPSTAFNLLFRLAQLKPDARQVRQMLDHRDSPYIRALGFLYLRYCCDPRKLWEWCHPYLRDTEVGARQRGAPRAPVHRAPAALCCCWAGTAAHRRPRMCLPPAAAGV